MRALLIASVCILAQPLQASRLKVSVITDPGKVVMVHQCVGYGDAPLAAEGGSDMLAMKELRFPGSVEVAVEGGTPPYRYDWHGMPEATCSAVSAMPGMVRVTISDAEGRHVTRSVYVGQVSKTLATTCGCGHGKEQAAPIVMRSTTDAQRAARYKRPVAAPHIATRPRDAENPTLRAPGPREGDNVRRVVPVTSRDHSTK